MHVVFDHELVVKFSISSRAKTLKELRRDEILAEIGPFWAAKPEILKS